MVGLLHGIAHILRNHLLLGDVLQSVHLIELKYSWKDTTSCISSSVWVPTEETAGVLSSKTRLELFHIFHPHNIMMPIAIARIMV